MRTQRPGRVGSGRRLWLRPDESPIPEVCVDAPESLAVEALVAQLAAFFGTFGLPPEAGRVWGTLYVSPTPLLPEDLSRQTGLSPACVAALLPGLLRVGAVKQTSAANSRRTHYEAEERLLRIVTGIVRGRELEAVRALREVTRATRAALASGCRLQRRLDQIEQVARLYEAMVLLVERLAAAPLAGVGAVVDWLRPRAPGRNEPGPSAPSRGGR